MKVFVKETGIQLAGGNVGVTVFDYLSNYVAGAIIPVGNANEPVLRATVNTIIKGVGGAGIMAAAGKVPNRDAGNFLVGMGGGPIMTILNDWVKVGQGIAVGDSAYVKARAKKGGGSIAAARTAAIGAPAAVSQARATGGATTQALRVGVF